MPDEAHALLGTPIGIEPPDLRANRFHVPGFCRSAGERFINQGLQRRRVGALIVVITFRCLKSESNHRLRCGIERGDPVAFARPLDFLGQRVGDFGHLRHAWFIARAAGTEPAAYKSSPLTFGSSRCAPCLAVSR